MRCQRRLHQLGPETDPLALYPYTWEVGQQPQGGLMGHMQADTLDQSQRLIVDLLNVGWGQAACDLV